VQLLKRDLWPKPFSELESGFSDGRGGDSTKGLVVPRRVLTEVFDIESGYSGGPRLLDYSSLSSEALVLECLHSGEEAAWTEFIRRFHALIASVVIRVARQWGEISTHAMDDVIQETYLKLCENRVGLLERFKSAHENAIYGYMKVFTANLAHDYFKASKCSKRGGATAIASLDSETTSGHPITPPTRETSLDRKLLIEEISSCLNTVVAPSSPRDQRIFWLYYRVGLSAKAIAALPAIGLTVKGVESTVQRLTRQVKELMGSDRGSSHREISRKGIRTNESL
jgi:RNA polymerase sigma-70 factor (ECF subfamily)